MNSVLCETKITSIFQKQGFFVLMALNIPINPVTIK